MAQKFKWDDFQTVVDNKQKLQFLAPKFKCDILDDFQTDLNETQCVNFWCENSNDETFYDFRVDFAKFKRWDIS